MNTDQCINILNAEQIRQADQFTIKNEPIASIDLMERASEAFVAKFKKLYSKDRSIMVFCGTGNNGGDGLAIARLLDNSDYSVSVFVIGNPDNGSRDFKVNLDIIDEQISTSYIERAKDFPDLEKDLIIIDAIFGSGLTRGVSGLFGELIDYINGSACRNIVAVDIASGLGCDNSFEDGKVLNVSETFTFQVAKLSHQLPQNNIASGEVHILHIGLDDDFIDSQETNRFIVTLEFAQSLYQSPEKYRHKGSAGRNLIIAGSRGKMGAAVLATKACLKSGAGLVTAYLPKCGVDIMQISVPEAMVIESHGDAIIVDTPDLNQYHSVGIGPGIGTDVKTAQALKSLLENSSGPLVIDADALNILADNPSWLGLLPKQSILTPHPGEFERLAGKWTDDYQRLELQGQLARRYSVVVVLKGANTSIATPDGSVFFNPTGNPGMATAGSGDVLTGILTSLVGQGYMSSEAAILGVYLHGLAGDVFIKNESMESLMASDLISALGQSFLKVSQ